MQHIDKNLSMPNEVAKWIKKNKPKNWNLGKDYHDGYVILKEQLRQEQKGLCCYCCQILKEQVTIEHLKSRKNYPKLIFDYSNLLLSCRKDNQCDKAKNNQELHLTPLMTECNTEIRLNLEGELEGATERANQAIDLLNLNNPYLCFQRKNLIDIFFNPDSDLNMDNLEEIFGFMEYEQANLYRYIFNKLNI